MIEEISKSQLIRLIDVFFIGPYLIYLSQKREINSHHSLVLSIIGLATIAYNANNFLENKDQQSKISEYVVPQTAVIGVRG